MSKKIFPKKFAVLALILLLSLFLRFYKISSLFPFNGDVAWDYLSAESFLKGGLWPLIGISSSVPWLHQGAFFTYLLIIILGLSKGNPVAPVIFTAALGVLTTFLVYFLGKKIFYEKAGLWSALFYAISPLSVFFDRFPYHLSPIAFFSLLFFWSLFKAIKGKTNTFILSSLLLGILMQFELSNLVLLPVLVIFFFLKRKEIPIRCVILSIFSFAFPWLPKIIYDFSHGPSQTLGYLAWVGHKLIPIGSLDIDKSIAGPILPNIKLSFTFLAKAIFPSSLIVSSFVFLLLLLFLVLHLKTKEKKNGGAFLLLLWLVIPLVCFLIMGFPSESYFPILLPGIAFLFGFILEKSTQIIKPVTLVFCATVLFLSVNVVFLFKNDFLVSGDKYGEIKETAEFIVKDAQDHNFNLIPLGSYAEFPGNILNLVYLTQYLGHGPSNKKAKNSYFVYNSGEQGPIKNALKVAWFGQMTIFRKK